MGTQYEWRLSVVAVVIFNATLTHIYAVARRKWHFSLCRHRTYKSSMAILSVEPIGPVPIVASDVNLTFLFPNFRSSSFLFIYLFSHFMFDANIIRRQRWGSNFCARKQKQPFLEFTIERNYHRCTFLYFLCEAIFLLLRRHVTCAMLMTSDIL